MSDRTDQSITDSLEAEKSILPHMPFLLQDLWALGASVDHIVEAVETLDLPAGPTRVLDLGCGKGAVLIGLASRFGFHGVGIDAMEPFLEDARKKAEEYEVSHLCEFRKQDMNDFVSQEHGFELVILASLGGILGSLKETMVRLRTQVRSGGYVLIDDGFLKKQDRIGRRGYGHYRNHEESITELTSFDDTLLTELNTTEFSLKINLEYLRVIENRGRELAAQHPELKENIQAYIDLQAEECGVIEEQIEGALWLLQKKSE